MALFGPPDVAQLLNSKNVKGLIKALQYKKDWEIREYAARALGELGDSQAIAPLIESLSDFPYAIREAAAEGLSAFGEAAIEPLVDALIEWEARKYAAQALVKIGPAVIPSLKEILEKGLFKNIRRVAAWIVGEIGGKAAAEALTKVLFDEDPDVRRSVARALAAIGEPAKAQLSAALESQKDAANEDIEWVQEFLKSPAEEAFQHEYPVEV